MTSFSLYMPLVGATAAKLIRQLSGALSVARQVGLPQLGTGWCPCILPSRYPSPA